jgi:2-keto-4-pentenoate hydratase/2-oxohepta-3-ene-1,7-dioic acid hydratase in catechol pathway
MMTRREAIALPAMGALPGEGPGTRFVRFRKDGAAAAYGQLDGSRIRELRGGLFGRIEFSGRTHDLAQVRLLFPCVPPKVWAVGLNYRSHLGSRPAPKQPEIFLKPTSCLQDPDGPIVIPPGAQNVHYEAELVLVIGRTVRNATAAEAAAAIFGYTCGNDVSERDWQNGPDKDLQWWRAKGADTFGPMGPVLVTPPWDPMAASIECRLNGQVKQQQKLSDLLFGPVEIVRFISRYATLEPGDVIFTGTPGSTTAMKPGDVVEVEIGGLGVLRNPVKAA